MLVAGSIRGGGRLHLFGSGHSQLVAVEATSRAGGLHCAHAIVDPALSPADPAHAGLVERVHGYAETVLACERLERGEVVVVVSNSGINPAPVEAALGCRERGLQVVAVTSVAHWASVPSRHRGGRRLFEVADVAIDTTALLVTPASPCRPGSAWAPAPPCWARRWSTRSSAAPPSSSPPPAPIPA